MGRATVDGIVAIGLPYQHPEVEEIRRAGIPMVTVDAVWPADMPTVDVEEERGSRQAATYLAGLGHRDILVISIDAPAANREHAHETIMARRMRGYRKGLADAGILEPLGEVVAESATIENGRAAFHARGRAVSDRRPCWP